MEKEIAGIGTFLSIGTIMYELDANGMLDSLKKWVWLERNLAQWLFLIDVALFFGFLIAAIVRGVITRKNALQKTNELISGTTNWTYEEAEQFTSGLKQKAVDAGKSAMTSGAERMASDLTEELKGKLKVNRVEELEPTTSKKSMAISGCIAVAMICIDYFQLYEKINEYTWLGISLLHWIIIIDAILFGGAFLTYAKKQKLLSTYPEIKDKVEQLKINRIAAKRIKKNLDDIYQLEDPADILNEFKEAVIAEYTIRAVSTAQTGVLPAVALTRVPIIPAGSANMKYVQSVAEYKESIFKRAGKMLLVMGIIALIAYILIQFVPPTV